MKSGAHLNVAHLHCELLLKYTMMSANVVVQYKLSYRRLPYKMAARLVTGKCTDISGHYVIRDVTCKTSIL